ncbi:MAG: hypothetical protein KJO01_01880 [Gammaproteobacteria bacterium]|nr:hypothetical protein [Gammaproteobacteria bacterium]
MKGRNLVFAGLFAFLIPGCGGGGGDAVTVTQPIVNANGGGIWVGQTTDDSQPGVTQDFVGVTTDSGEFRFLSLDTFGQFIGTFTVSGNAASGTGLGWAPIGFTWTDGTVLTSVSITATVTERQQFNGSWSTGTSESGTFTFAYSDTHQRTSSFSKLSANWFYTDGLYSVTISIDQNGSISGSDTDGCVYVGDASIPDASVNTYAFDVTVMSCGPFNGMYAGLAVLDDDTVQDDTLILSIDNGQVAIVLVMAR